MEVYNMSSLMLALKLVFSKCVIFILYIYIYLFFIREDCVKLSLLYNYRV